MINSDNQPFENFDINLPEKKVNLSVLYMKIFSNKKQIILYISLIIISLILIHFIILYVGNRKLISINEDYLIDFKNTKFNKNELEKQYKDIKTLVNENEILQVIKEKNISKLKKTFTEKLEEYNNLEKIFNDLLIEYNKKKEKKT